MTGKTSTLDVLTFNINNPSLGRAERQLAYFATRPEHVFVLTETADSAGCAMLEARFRAAGYSVVFPPLPNRGERGVMIVSRLKTRLGPATVGYLPHRAVAVTIDTDRGPLDIIGLYVPSRDTSQAKIDRKQRFMKECAYALPTGAGANRIVLGDLNVLEPDHTPRYRFFQPWEYDFYCSFAEAGYQDAFRLLHPDAREYSWVGRTGDGYRYDHAHVSTPLADTVKGCSYLHEVRTMDNRLTDHSGLSMQLALTPTGPLATTDPRESDEHAAALF